MQIIGDIEEIRKTEYVDAYYLAVVYGALGECNKAFEELERASKENSINLCLLEVDPRMDPLRHDPRFERLRKHVFPRDEAATPAFNPSDSLQRPSTRV